MTAVIFCFFFKHFFNFRFVFNSLFCLGIKISTDASLQEMFAPGALVMLSPLIVGFLFGVQALAGLLAGALVSGVQMAISQSNTGGAWVIGLTFVF